MGASSNTASRTQTKNISELLERANSRAYSAVPSRAVAGEQPDAGEVLADHYAHGGGGDQSAGGQTADAGSGKVDMLG
jgi:hypothetical protein